MSNYVRVFVGARSTSSSAFLLGAFGVSDWVFANTWDMYRAHENNGVYWYNFPGRSFGFSPSADVYLNSADTTSSDPGRRLSWHIDNGSGGYRAGSYYPSSNYYKEVYVAPYPRGVLLNGAMNESTLTTLGFELCYDASYSSSTTQSDLSGCFNAGSW